MKRYAGCVIVCMGLFAGMVRAQDVSLHFGAANPVYDEFGQLLQGTSDAAGSYGFPVVQGELVQILSANAGVFPPDAAGQPHPSNPLLAETKIGAGVDPALGVSGLFSGTILGLKRDSSGSTNRIFARVFNAPALDQATFYADSQTYDVPVWGKKYGVFMANVASTTKEVDPSDNDQDGLSRSWERSYGSNPDHPDSDGDGMIDGAEIRAGTGLLDPDSLLMMVRIMSPPGAVWNEDEGMFMDPPKDLVLTWDAVTGKTYQIEFTTNSLAESPLFVEVNAPITATGMTAATVITNGLDLGATLFRVRLVEE